MNDENGTLAYVRFTDTYDVVGFIQFEPRVKMLIRVLVVNNSEIVFIGDSYKPTHKFQLFEIVMYSIYIIWIISIIAFTVLNFISTFKKIKSKRFYIISVISLKMRKK